METTLARFCRRLELKKTVLACSWKDHDCKDTQLNRITEPPTKITAVVEENVKEVEYDSLPCLNTLRKETIGEKVS